MAVEIGQVVPDFVLVTDEKESFRLSDHRGKNVLLLFFPGAFTSVCTTELNDVNADLAFFAGANTLVVGISTDSPFALAEFRRVHEFGFPLLSDHDADVSNRFGAKYSPGAFVLGLHRISRRAAFVVDAEGIVRYAEVLDNAGDQPDFESIRRLLNPATISA